MPMDNLPGRLPDELLLGNPPPPEVGGKPPPLSPGLCRRGASARPVGADGPLGLRRPASIVGFLLAILPSVCRVS